MLIRNKQTRIMRYGKIHFCDLWYKTTNYGMKKELIESKASTANIIK